ncbi:MAG: hypothetical protein ACTHVY_12170 [Brevibacterium yomogidense]|uniref:Uncharacterized protein n=1 Tax=Brevibacterium yomogidense TaxID=946573 RepID=A0A1X6X8B9_9MICO|nr:MULTISPECIES: hypothetical protein [Brevibacterium]SLM95584.1 hypothetical protein FM105_04970 [Brevibacterium yomogidense]SMX72244.1 hypothetical protein BSP109_00891 [Brevibacterium sp. Mu109]
MGADNAPKKPNSDSTTPDGVPQQSGNAPRELSPAAQAAIARYRRLMGNVADPEPGDAAMGQPRSDLERHLAERPPHWAPPRSEASRSRDDST